MSRKIEFRNNFEAFKDDFKNDTGLIAKDNVETYIQYINFRMTDRNFQLNWHIMQELVDLPGILSFKLGKS